MGCRTTRLVGDGDSMVEMEFIMKCIQIFVRVHDGDSKIVVRYEPGVKFANLFGFNLIQLKINSTLGQKAFRKYNRSTYES